MEEAYRTNALREIHSISTAFLFYSVVSFFFGGYDILATAVTVVIFWIIRRYIWNVFLSMFKPGKVMLTNEKLILRRWVYQEHNYQDIKRISIVKESDDNRLLTTNVFEDRKELSLKDIEVRKERLANSTSSQEELTTSVPTYVEITGNNQQKSYIHFSHLLPSQWKKSSRLLKRNIRLLKWMMIQLNSFTKSSHADIRGNSLSK